MYANPYGPDFGGELAFLLGFLSIVFFLGAALALVLYILNNLGFQRLAANRGLSNPWLIWIPILGEYTVGALVDDIQQQQTSHRGIFRYLLVAGAFLSASIWGSGLSSILYSFALDPYAMDHLAGPGLFASAGSLFGFAYYVLRLVALNKIFKSYRPQNATTWTVLCVFLPFLTCIFPFAIRNDRPYQYGGGGPRFGSFYQASQNQGAPDDSDPWNQQQNSGFAQQEKPWNSYDPNQR